MRASNSPGSERLVLGTRLALVAGFGSLLVIMAVGGYYGIRELQGIRERDRQIREEFLSRNRTLNNIRSQIYLSGTYIRDYMLDPDVGHAEYYRSNLEQLRVQMQSALQLFREEFGPEQTEHIAELSLEIAKYWQILAPTFQWDAAQRQHQGYTFLRDAIFPRRSSMLSIADHIAELNEQQLSAGNLQVDDLLLAFQTRLAMILAAALLVGLGMAAFSTQSVLRLESQANAQYQEVVGVRKDLAALSGRLVHAQESERRALSRELHDEIGQALSAVLIELSNLAAQRTVQNDGRSQQHVETAKGLVENSIRVIRNMALLLRPSMLDDLGLIPALNWQARETQKRTGMDITLAADLTSDELSDDYKTCIYRVVQETLQNCARHAHATKVQINIQQDAALLKLSIRDNGVGFDIRRTKGLGLLGIEERVTSLGGKCQVQSSPGSGTTMNVELPFQIPERNAVAHGN